MKKNIWFAALAGMLLLVLILPQAGSAQFDPDIFKAMKARNIGPANMSGRIGAIAAVPSDPRIIYVGTATGGLWKSTDAGITWKPIFDDQPVSSIGAIAINPQNPDMVWVGTGEAAPRNSVGVGRGIYLTLDAGKTWKFMGLEKTEKISKILLHPTNPNIVYVAALGTTWGENPERGVFKTEDGGKTWKKILYVDEKTGASDMCMAPDNPNKILVGMWQHRRWPWFFKSGGPGSGLYLTVDGGESWKKLTEKEGLPKGELGKIGVAFAPSNPNIAYALVEAKKSVLLRSTDGGYTWSTINNKSEVGNRPFYYHRIFVNPKNENLVYILQSRLVYSEDGGKSFRSLTRFNQAHSDFHAMWLHPNGEMLMVGNDGGVVISNNRGKTWRFVTNLPVGQFYHVSYDMQLPYNVYGGLQDNGSWMGPAYVLKERAIYPYMWKTVGGGDGFDVEPDPEKPGAGYGMSQGGNLYYFDTELGISRSCVPTESDVKHRYNWNAGFAVDPFHPSTIYLGSQFVHKSTDKGFTWEIISPDLTTNDPEKQRQSESGGLTLDVTNAENHCTIICIAPSPVQEGVIWVGTDDGNVQLTRDGGKTWELVSKKLTSGKKGWVPPNTWVSHVEASKHDAATAYVTFDDHRRSNWTPYVYVTHDFGKTWKSLVTPEIDGFCHVVEEDPVNKNLLFLGTEFGLFVSFNGGKNWMKWTHGVPTVPVRDIAVHPRENDLILGTHGRSIFIVDDISPLREMSQQLVQEKLHFFAVPDAYQFQSGRLTSYMTTGDAVFVGQNKQLGACFTYYLIPTEKKETEAEEQSDEMRSRMMERMRQFGGQFPFARAMMSRRSSRVLITIKDNEGKTVARLNGTEEKGINRVYWNFREQLPRRGSRQSTQGTAGSTSQRSRFRMGMTVLPGKYTATIKYGDLEATQSFEVKPDPRIKVDLAVLKENYRLGKEAQKFSETFNQVGSRLENTKKAIETVLQYVRSQRRPENRDIMKAARELQAKLDTLNEQYNPQPKKQGIADRSAGLRSQVMSAVSGYMRAGIHPVSQAAKVKFEKVKKQVAAFYDQINQFYQKDVAEFRRLLEDSGFSLFPEYKPLKIE